MITILAFRDKGWYNERRTEYRLYDHLCRAYGVEFKFVSSSEEVKKIAKGKKIIIFDENGDIPLSDFKHEKDAFYVFGRTGQDLRKDFPNHIFVRIETPYQIALFGAVACGIVLEDRRRKNGNYSRK